jgi:hypothetical protein
MATLSAVSNEPTNATIPAKVDMRLEVVVIPVSDVDRAKHAIHPRTIGANQGGPCC